MFHDKFIYNTQETLGNILYSEKDAYFATESQLGSTDTCVRSFRIVLLVPHDQFL